MILCNHLKKRFISISTCVFENELLNVCKFGLIGYSWVVANGVSLCCSLNKIQITVEILRY